MTAMDAPELLLPPATPDAEPIPALTEGASHQRARSLNGEPGVASAFCGFVEALTPQGGLTGWVTGEHPSQALAVSLWIDGEEVARTQARYTRPDIWHPNQVDFLAGFAFELESLLPLLARTDLSPAEPLEVRIVDQPWGLMPARPWTLADILVLLQALDADAAVERSIANLPPHLALSRLTRRANRLLMRTRRTDQAQCVGTIESLSVLAGEFVILGGWWSRLQPNANSAVLVSGQQKSAAGLLAVTFDRQDLDRDHCGFMALLRVQGGLSFEAGLPQFTLSLGEGQTAWLATLRQLRVVTSEAALAELLQRAGVPASGGPRAAAVAAFAQELLPWSRSAHPEKPATSIGIDAFLIAPGFGVFVSGWVMSSMGTLTDVSAQIGASLCLLDPDSLSFDARPDLRDAFPVLGDRVRYAGFSALLRGFAAPDLSSRWQLRLRFSDQSTAFFEVPMDRARLIDHDFDLSALGEPRFGLLDAPWLREFVDIVYGRTLKLESWLAPPQAGGDAALIQVLPDTPHGQVLVMDQLRRQAGLGAFQNLGLIVLAPKTVAVGPLRAWLSSLRTQAPGLVAAVGRMPAGAHAWQILPDVLRQSQVRRFAVAGPDVCLSTEGVQAVAASLQVDPHLPVFLAIEHLVGGTQVRHSREAQAFAWCTAAYLRFREHDIALVSGFFERNGMDADQGCIDLAPTRSAHGMRLNPVRKDGLAARVNRRLLQG